MCWMEREWVLSRLLVLITTWLDIGPHLSDQKTMIDHSNQAGVGWNKGKNLPWGEEGISHGGMKDDL